MVGPLHSLKKEIDSRSHYNMIYCAKMVFSFGGTTWISALKMHHLSSNAKHIDSPRSSLLISRGLTGTEQLRTVEWHHRQILLRSLLKYFGF